jgi:uncharacterized tellurite resistance protein B-like protein
MLDSIRAMFSRSNATPAAANSGTSTDPVAVAACALLLDIAYADGEFSDAERAHLDEVLARHFGLSREEGHKLIEIADAERRGAIDHFAFTSVVKSNYDLGQKMVLAEVMWGLILSDGEIAEHEQYLARKIGNFLDLTPAYLSSARKSATEKAGREGGG